MLRKPNRKSENWMTVWSLVFLLMFSISFPVSGQEGDGFSDSFDDPTLQGWERSQDVLVSDGVLRINPDNFAFRQGIWENPDMTVKIKFTPPGGIVLHYHAAEGSVYRLILSGEGDVVEISLEREMSGTISPLGGAMVSDFIPGDWNTVQISFDGSQHQIFVNSTLLITVEDSSPLPAGGIGFFVFGENAAELDDLVVSAAEGTPGEPVGGEPVGEEPPSEGEAPEMQAGELPPASIQTTPVVTPMPGTGTRSLIEELFVSGVNPLDLPAFAINLGLAALLAFILSRVYIYWGASLSNRRKFAANFMLMTVTTTFIILVVRSSVALSLGLVGALSIVRFRAAIKEPEELAYLFLAIGLGIGLGDNQRLITILAFAVSILVLGLMKLLRRSQADVNMHLNITSQAPNKLDMDRVMSVLKPHCSKIKLLRFDETDKLLELSFLVELGKVSDLSQARAALQQLSPNVNITFLDNKGIW